MSSDGLRIKRRVWVALVAGAAGVGAWGWWVKSRPVSLEGQRPDSIPFVQLASAGTSKGSTVLQERAALLDPTPLFFPTEWNYGQTPLGRPKQTAPGQVFGGFGAKLTVNEQAIASLAEESASVPEKLLDVLVHGNEAPFAGMGERDSIKSTLPIRAGFLEVLDLKDGKNIISQALTGIQLPRSDYAPLEFLVVVGSGGLIGDPILTSSSGWDEVDAFFRAYLVESYHLGERLSPGRYRVLVGA